MPRANRIDPWGDLHAVAERGLLTGNRGCLVDSRGTLTRHHRGSLWISCVTEYRDWKQPLAAPHRWTPLFFLDEAVALAAGHRPCGLCRRDAYSRYRAAVAKTISGAPPSATELNRRLSRERLMAGRGLDRAGDRRTTVMAIATVPVGAIIADPNGIAQLVCPDRLLTFSFGGWTAPVAKPTAGDVNVLTPPTSCLALMHGYEPLLHPSSTTV